LAKSNGALALKNALLVEYLRDETVESRALCEEIIPQREPGNGVRHAVLVRIGPGDGQFGVTVSTGHHQAARSTHTCGERLDGLPYETGGGVVRDAVPISIHRNPELTALICP